MIDWSAVLAETTRGKTIVELADSAVIFMQGQPADALYFLLAGKVRLGVASHEGKEAIVATLGAGEFFGEGCLADQPFRMATATAAGPCTVMRIEKPTMVRMLRDQPGFAQRLVTQMATRLTQYEADLVDQLLNSSEERLARLLLLLSHFGKESKTETLVAGVNQEHLAQMVGTTRSRINYFMNKFRKQGFIEYDAKAGLTVHRGLLGVVLQEQPD